MNEKTRMERESRMSDKWIRLDSDDILGDAPLWRYMDLPKFLWLLEHKQLYFPSVSDLWSNDPHEGVEFARSTQLGFDKTLKAYSRKLSRISEEQGILPLSQDPDLPTGINTRLTRKLAHGAYVSCWRQGDHHSRAMWKLYTGGEGVAIEITLDELLDNIDASTATGSCFASPVVYLDFDSEDDEQGMKDGKMHPEVDLVGSDLSDPENIPFFEVSTFLYRRKRQEFDFEKEYRLLIPTFPTAPGTWKPERKLTLGIKSLEELIKKVHIDPYGQNPELFKEVVRSYLDVHGLEETPVCL